MTTSPSLASATPGIDETAPASVDLAAAAGLEHISDRVPPLAKGAYALGGATDTLGHWLYNSLASPVFNVYLGLTPTEVSYSLLASRLVDAFTDPLFGWLSDNTRSRWGRRRPFILIGSLFAGLGLPLLFMASASWSHDTIFWFMVLSACLYAPFISAYNMPYQSLGAELTPSYHERTRVLAWKAVVQKIAGVAMGAGGWFAALHIWDDPLTGRTNMARGAMWFCAMAGGVMVLAGVANFLFVRERYYDKAQHQARVGFFEMIGQTLTCRPYLILLATVLVYGIPTGLIGSLGFYVSTYHVFHGDVATSQGYAFAASLLYAAFGAFIGVPTATWLARRLGKPKALTCVMLFGLVAFGSSWWLYDPAHPWLSVVQTGLNGFAATGLWVILPSMCADVIDYDELHSGKRREGAYSSTFAWVQKVGMAAAFGLVGPLLDKASGFDAKLGGNQSPHAIFMMRMLFTAIPVGALLLALLFVQFFPLTRERMLEIRAELEQRRGRV